MQIYLLVKMSLIISAVILTSSRWEYYIFSVPPCGIIFSENLKKFLAINSFVVNETKSGQPNKCLFSLTFIELNG